MSESVGSIIELAGEFKFAAVEEGSDPMMSQLQTAYMAQSAEKAKAEMEKMEAIVDKVVANLKLLARFSGANKPLGNENLMFYKKQREMKNRNSRSKFAKSEIALGRVSIEMDANLESEMYVMSSNLHRTSAMSNEPVATFETAAKNVQLSIFSINSNPPTSVEKIVASNELQLMKFVPNEDFDFYIFLRPTDVSQRLLVFLGYNIKPRPSELLYELKF